MRDLEERLKSASVLVCGDLMLDRYWHGATTRISPEAPVPVVRIESREDRPGGAANVALNVAELGASVRLLGVVGNDDVALILRDLLEARGVGCAFQVSDGAATITKLRVLSQHQQLLRMDFEPARGGIGAIALASLQAMRPMETVVVYSDYAKGALNEVTTLIDFARTAGCRVVVDPKGTDFGRYAGASVITPNQREFEAEVGAVKDDEDLVARGIALCQRHQLGAVLVTRGEHGMTLIEADGAVEHLAAQARDVYDVTGAGDTVCAVLAVGLAAGFSLADSMRLANVAAGVVVGKLGTASVSVAELRRGLSGGVHADGVVTEDALLAAVRSARARGERIVMTNGCFDLLHAGHVAYLREARALGDRLIVAVNDDASVRGLKGETRPVNPLHARMAVLAGLAAVDWVVPFSEDTPARLIAAVLPDVLVKGGDYRPEQIAGAAEVLAGGGEVRVLDFLPGYSSSDMIARAQRRGVINP